jgi:hypothetical protein
LTINDDPYSELRLSPSRKTEESLRWLARAKDHPLSISIRTINDDHSSLIGEIIMPHLSRVKALHLDLPLHFYSAFKDLPPGAGPILEDLKLSATNFSEDTFFHSIDLKTLFPRLHTAKFSIRPTDKGFLGSRIAFNTPWSQLRSLDIQEPDMNMIRLLKALSECTSLVTCKFMIYQNFLPDSTQAPPSHATLHHLKTLDISYSRDACWTYNHTASSRVFEYFTLPALTTLTLQGTGAFNRKHRVPASGLVGLQLRSQFSLEFLNVFNFDFVEDEGETIRLFKRSRVSPP